MSGAGESVKFESAPTGGRVVAIGVFDGVHLGHQTIIKAAVSEATHMGARPSVVTFQPHPDSVLRPESAPRYLTSHRRKSELLLELGMREVVSVEFDEAFARLSPEDFCGLVLSKHLGARTVFVGENFRFGKGGMGLPGDLVDYGKSHGFRVKAMALLNDRGDPISSTRIRDLIGSGDVESAVAMLGRPHRVEGVVVHGTARGRSLGAPTANVEADEGLMLPLQGVYVTRTLLSDGASYDSVTSVGSNPTFGDSEEEKVETLLLDYEGGLYGEKVSVDFVKRLRSQVDFDDADALRRQIQEDIEQARTLHQHARSGDS